MHNNAISLTVSFDMDERTAKLFLQSAIERVISTSTRIVEKSSDEDAYINLEDWQEWKPVICSIWVALHDAAYRKLSGMPESNRAFILQKGE